MKHKRNILIIIIDIFLGVALIYEFGSLGISLFVKMNFTIAFIAIIMMYKRLGIFSYLKYTIGQYLPTLQCFIQCECQLQITQWRIDVGYK